MVIRQTRRLFSLLYCLMKTLLVDQILPCKLKVAYDVLRGTHVASWFLVTSFNSFHGDGAVLAIWVTFGYLCALLLTCRGQRHFDIYLSDYAALKDPKICCFLAVFFLDFSFRSCFFDYIFLIDYDAWTD